VIERLDRRYVQYGRIHAVANELLCGFQAPASVMIPER
jgi:hypothetical protein